MAFQGLTALYHYEVLIWTQTINHSINLNKLLSFKFCLVVVKRRLKICAVWPAPWRCTNSGNNHTDLIHRLEIPYWHWSLRSAVVSHFMDQLDPSWQNNWPFLCYCNVKFPPSPISCKVNNTSSVRALTLASGSTDQGETPLLWTDPDRRPWHLPQELRASSPRHGWYIWRSLNGPKWDPGVRASSDHLAPLWVPELCSNSASSILTPDWMVDECAWIFQPIRQPYKQLPKPPSVSTFPK